MAATSVHSRIDAEKIRKNKETISKVKSELRRAVVGQEAAIDAVVRSLLCGGHLLIEGVPGIAKTLMMISLASVVNVKFKRIQFTPDMLPSDITGIQTYDPKKGFTTIKGPVFTNFVLADEINRAPPKVQSALLEAMQEYKVTIGDTTYDLERPFLVMATQNTIESLGVYDLPAAQLDRFLFKLVMRYPSFDEEKLILRRNITLNEFSEFQLRPVIGPREIGEMQALTKQVYVSSQVEDYIVRLIEATRQPAKYNLDTARYIEEGSSPRGSIALYIAAKAQALMSGSTFATPEHVKDVANDVLSHRIIINYEGQAEGIRQDKIVHEMLAKVPIS